MSWQPPIFDRTQIDVNRVLELNEIGWDNMTPEERNEFSQPMKGALNGSDIARINGNINFINTIYSLGLQPLDETALTGDPYITLSRFEDQHAAMVTVRNRCAVRHDTPYVPEGTVPSTYQDINAIERILFDAYELWFENQEAKRYTGEVTCQNGWLDLI